MARVLEDVAAAAALLAPLKDLTPSIHQCITPPAWPCLSLLNYAQPFYCVPRFDLIKDVHIHPFDLFISSWSGTYYVPGLYPCICQLPIVPIFQVCLQIKSEEVTWLLASCHIAHLAESMCGQLFSQPPPCTWFQSCRGQTVGVCCWSYWDGATAFCSSAQLRALKIQAPLGDSPLNR